MKNKTKKFIIPLDTYEAEILFIISKDKDKIEKIIKNYFDNDYDLKRMENARTEYGGKWAQESNGAIKNQRAFVAGGSNGRNKRTVWSINYKP